MLEPRKTTTPVAVRTGAIVGFTPLERAGLGLLLAEHQVIVVAVLDELTDFGAAVRAEIVLVDLDTATRDAARRDALNDVLVGVRDRHPHLAIFGIYHGLSGVVLAPAAASSFDALVDADGRPETMLAVILGTGTARRAWHKPTISVAPLTPREQEILLLIADGNTSRSAAESLGISIHTVDSHKQRVFRRLGVQNQAQAVSVALRLGLLDRAEQHQGAAS